MLENFTERLNLITFPISNKDINKRSVIIKQLQDLIMNIDSKSFMSDKDFNDIDDEYLTSDEKRNIRQNLDYIISKVIK